MCGIIGIVSQRNTVPMLVKGLQRLEYRGYDSCGLAVHGTHSTGHTPSKLLRMRSIHRVSDLSHQVQDPQHGLKGTSGIAHTRWATHGVPSVCNAHPHFSRGPSANINAAARVAVVHNGIIENHNELRASLIERGYSFKSQTDTEVIAHLMDATHQGDPLQAVHRALSLLKGAYALAVLFHDQPERIIAARSGSPLVLGIGQEEIYLASDPLAMADETDQVIYMDDGDVVDIRASQYNITDREGRAVTRPTQTVKAAQQVSDLKGHAHQMHKEIFEQARIMNDSLEHMDRISSALFDGSSLSCGNQTASSIFKAIDAILILGCGTSHFSACVARHWLETIARVPTQVEVASEYRYRNSLPNPKSLVVAVSQSGETADTLAALRHAKHLGMAHTLALCNVPTSTMVRECALAHITQAGPEIGVASTKAFTSQLLGWYVLALGIAQAKGHLSIQQEAGHLHALRQLPKAIEQTLLLEGQLQIWAQNLSEFESAIFVGRGIHHAIAQEGALKLKEISYIHAEAFTAGELKHGPLALISPQMPVIALAPADDLQAKLSSNLQEICARGGPLYVLADARTALEPTPDTHTIRLPEAPVELSPWLHVVALQLLAYHTAKIRGADIDKPRNLAKSVTVE